MNPRPTLGKLEQVELLRAMEIEEARNIQQAMVCSEPLQADCVEIASRFRPVIEVGGDFLDYFLLEDRRFGIYLGDVVGKGLAAAMYAALAMGTMRGIHKSGTNPTSVMALMNERLRMRVVPGRYCALQYAVYDPAERLLCYANAGLPRPILISSKGCREVGEGGLPSGLFAGAEYDMYSLEMQPGEAVLFHTDGILEARCASGDDFGMERMLQLCTGHAHSSPDTVLNRLFAEVDAFTGDGLAHDDMTAIILKVS